MQNTTCSRANNIFIQSFRSMHKFLLCMCFKGGGRKQRIVFFALILLYKCTVARIAFYVCVRVCVFIIYCRCSTHIIHSAIIRSKCINNCAFVQTYIILYYIIMSYRAKYFVEFIIQKNNSYNVLIL